MDKLQVEAIARAILEPDQKAQEELRRKRLQEDRSLAERRTVAWFVLAGVGVGAVIAYFTGHRFTNGVLWGGIAAGAFGWLFVGLRRRSAP